MKKDNEELLVEANELLRKELEEAKTQLATRQHGAAVGPTVLAYAVLLVGTVAGTLYMAVVERSFLPLLIGVFSVGWIGDRLRAAAGLATYRQPVRTRRSTNGIRIDISTAGDDAREEGLADPAPRSRKKARG